VTTIHAITEHKGLRLKGSLAVQGGVPMLQAFGPAGRLRKHTKVDTYDHVTRDGYQRDLVPSRVRAAATYYESGGRMPNPLLVNIRKDDFTKIEVHVLEDEAGYREAIESEGDWIGLAEIYIPEGVPLWVYDGQHRNGAINEVVDRDLEFGSFPVPVCCTVGLDTPEEMKEFYEVNQNAKAVKTDLAWELLRKMAETDQELRELLEVKDQDWTIRGEDVTDELVKLGGVWAGTLQEANQKKVRTDRLALNKAQFVRSLRPVLAMPSLTKADPATVAKILHAYWEGIAKVIPEPFAATTNPKEWVIQKGPGAISLHRVLPQVIEVLRARGERLGDPAAYADVLRDLPQLSGEVVDEQGNSKIVSGAEFWRSGPEGVASQFTGDAGRKRLGVRIQALLPKPTETLNV